MDYSLLNNQNLSERSIDDYPCIQDRTLLRKHFDIINMLNNILREEDPEQQQHLANVARAAIESKPFEYFGFLRLHKELREEFHNCPVLPYLSSLAFINLNALKEHALHYFKEIYKDKEILNISFSDKLGGEQLGTILKITAKNMLTSSIIPYYIKIYQYGNQEDVRKISSIDPKELMVYQILDYIGLGEEVHFFYDPSSLKGFYIGTKDAGYYKTPETASSFITYEDLSNKELNQSIPEDIDENIIYGLFKVDMLARLLGLEDLTDNATNFGFVRKKHKTKVKILDFYIGNNSIYPQSGLYENFIAGVGTIDLMIFPDKAFKWMCGRNIEFKIERGKQFFQELQTEAHKKKSFLDAVEASWHLVNNILNRYEKDLKVESPELLNYNFKRYYQTIIENYNLFCSKFGYTA